MKIVPNNPASAIKRFGNTRPGRIENFAKSLFFTIEIIKETSETIMVYSWGFSHFLVSKN
jgi:hypothetical protein